MITPLEMATKELVATYYYTDLTKCRDAEESVVISGRSYIKLGTRTAITAVGNLYKIGPSVEPFKYLLVVGIARQKEDRLNAREVSLEDGYELAETQAYVNPVIRIELDNEISETGFKELMEVYATRFLKPRFLLTEEELNISHES